MRCNNDSKLAASGSTAADKQDRIWEAAVPMCVAGSDGCLQANDLGPVLASKDANLLRRSGAGAAVPLFWAMFLYDS